MPLSKFVMVGDNLETDILFGNRCGIDTCCVLSGNTSEERAKALILDGVRKSEEEGMPTYVMPYFSYSETLKL